MLAGRVWERDCMGQDEGGDLSGGSLSVGARSGWASNHRAETGDQRGCAETGTAAVEEPCGLGDTREPRCSDGV
jgi:hypothetical protein